MSYCYYITTYNRPDLLDKCIKSLPEGSEYHVIDTRKLGKSLAWAWNTAMREGLENHNHVIICNDDIEFIGNTGGLLSSSLHGWGISDIAMTTAWNIDIPDSKNVPGMFCFCVDLRFPLRFGWFDEGYDRCCCEDSDMLYRIHMAGYKVATVAPVKHLERGSVGDNVNEEYFKRNVIRYCIKWGGLYTNEKYTVPFHGLTEDEAYEEFLNLEEEPDWLKEILGYGDSR